MRLLSAGIGALGLLGCARVITHIPDAQPVPLFQKQGELRVAASYQPGKGVNAAVDLALGKHLAMLAGGAFAEHDNCFSCSKEVTRHFELGIGAFEKMGSGGNVGEVYFGLGIGSFKTSASDGSWDPQLQDITVSAGSYNEAFLQADFGRNKTVCDLAASMRLSGFRYYDFGKWDGAGAALFAPSEHWGLFLEPAFTFRVGYKHLKAENQIGVSLPLYQASGMQNQRLWLTIGVSMSAIAQGH